MFRFFFCINVVVVVVVGLLQIYHVSSFQPFQPYVVTGSQRFKRQSHLLLPTSSMMPVFSKSSSSIVLSMAASPSTTKATSTNKAADDDDEGIGAWIPLGSIKSLTGLGPQRITVMGMDLVVWHTTPEEEKEEETSSDEKEATKMIWSAQTDACTHRLAPLSQGRVNPNTNCIECPYHGWQFDTDGTLKVVPQIEDENKIDGLQKVGGNVQTYPVRPVGDFLFVFLPSSLHGEMFPQSLLPEEYYAPYLDDLDDRQLFVRELPYSFDFLVENFMDPAHIPFAHHKLQSTRDDATSIQMKEIVSNFTHVEVSFKDITAKRHRDGYSVFQRPSFFHFGEFQNSTNDSDTQEEEEEGTTTTTTKTEKSKKPSLKIFMTPVRAGRCRVFFHSPQLGILSKIIPTALMHAGSNRFLNTDTWLHDTEREVIRRKELVMKNKNKKVNTKLAGMDYIVGSQSDLGVSAFRKWWKNNGMADAPPHTFAMATMDQLGSNNQILSRREQIDPWEYHTKQCATCRQSLKRMKQIQAVCLFTAIASGCTFLTRRLPIAGLLGIGVSLYTRLFFKKFATALEGNPERSLIGDRSVAADADD